MLLTQENGGAMRDRTADLLRARQALSQLSYSPNTGLFLSFVCFLLEFLLRLRLSIRIFLIKASDCEA